MYAGIEQSRAVLSPSLPLFAHSEGGFQVMTPVRTARSHGNVRTCNVYNTLTHTEPWIVVVIVKSSVCFHY